LDGKGAFTSSSAYVDAVSNKLQHIGSLNLPTGLQEDYRYRTGNRIALLLDAAIKADGSLYAVTVVRSSGNTDFDDAAIQIVKQSAPFPQFPESLRKQADVIHIKRQWVFGKTDIKE
jgi:TonB family protein